MALLRHVGYFIVNGFKTVIAAVVVDSELGMVVVEFFPWRW